MLRAEAAPRVAGGAAPSVKPKACHCGNEATITMHLRMWSIPATVHVCEGHARALLRVMPASQSVVRVSCGS